MSRKTRGSGFATDGGTAVKKATTAAAIAATATGDGKNVKNVATAKTTAATATA